MSKRFYQAIGLALLLAAYSSDSWGESERAPPQSQETKGSQQPAPIDQRGAEQSPAVAKMVPAQKTAAEPKDDNQERESKSASDWWLVKLTAALALIGALQLAVFAWQGIQLQRTVTAAKDATKLAQQEFAATHRPKIIIYGMEAQSAGSDARQHVHFRYVNAGDTDAFVTSIASRILWTAKNMAPAGIEFHSHDAIKKSILVPSGMNGFAITPDEVDSFTLVRSGRGGHDTAVCVGVLVYRDTNDIERRTGFCRRYDSERERWLSVEDEDYEYAY